MGDQGRAESVRTRPDHLCEPSVTPVPRVIVLLGVSGSGKTTVGQALAARLGWAFEDADDHHSRAAVQKMARGVGLTDADRDPWLDRLARLVRQRAEDGPPTVLACSALKARYRRRLIAGRDDVALAWLDVPPSVLAARLHERPGHIAGPSLLPSQLAAFEAPADALRLDGRLGVADLAESVANAMGLGTQNAEP